MYDLVFDIVEIANSPRDGLKFFFADRLRLLRNFEKVEQQEDEKLSEPGCQTRHSSRRLLNEEKSIYEIASTVPLVSKSLKSSVLSEQLELLQIKSLQQFKSAERRIM